MIKAVAMINISEELFIPLYSLLQIKLKSG